MHIGFLSLARADGVTRRGGGEGLKGVQTDTAIELLTRASVRPFATLYFCYKRIAAAPSRAIPQYPLSRR